jgi:hypothetical protein
MTKILRGWGCNPTPIPRVSEALCLIFRTAKTNKVPLRKLGLGEHFFPSDKGCKNHTTNFRLNGERLKAFPQDQDQDKDDCFQFCYLTLH